MVVQCPKCEKKYKIDSDKITEKGAKITCPNCKNSFIVKKKPEEEDFIPCSICGSPATIDLNTDNPICEECKVKEEEKAARFIPMMEEEGGGAPFDREIDLKAGESTEGVSFGDLSGGDYAPEAYSTQVLPGEGDESAPPSDNLDRYSSSSTDKNVDFNGPEPELPMNHPAYMQATPPPTQSPVREENASGPASFVEAPHETAAAMPAKPPAPKPATPKPAPKRPAAPKPSEPAPFVEAPHETAAAMPSEPEPEDFFDGAPTGPPPSSDPFKHPEGPPSANPDPVLPTPRKEPTPPPPSSEPTPPPVRPEPTRTALPGEPTPPPAPSPKSTPPPADEESIAPPAEAPPMQSKPRKKSSPVPLIITIVLLGVIVAYLVYVFKDYF